MKFGGELKQNTTESKIQSIERVNLNVPETIKEIANNLSNQPLSVQSMWGTMKDKFFAVKEIQSKKFMFTKINGKDILSLVKEDENSCRYKIRVFRFSGSDHQWKTLPGIRSDGSYMKGEETNPLHHYVQSAKLHKDMYKALNELPQNNRHYSAIQYLPKPTSIGEEFQKHFGGEFEFKENYESFKNKEWAQFQKLCQDFFSIYQHGITKIIEITDYSKSGEFYKLLENNPAAEIQNIKSYIDELSKDEYAKFILSQYSLNVMEDMKNYPHIQKLVHIYKENIGAYLENIFSLPFPRDMVPDFKIENRIDAYDKLDIVGDASKNNIHIEEYSAKSLSGDIVVFAMAYDDKERIYIDNIYDPSQGMSDYGTLEKIVQMGHLVYKPEDYLSKTYGIPDKYKTVDTVNKYVDISALWGKLPPISKFKDELVSRGLTNK